LIKEIVDDKDIASIVAKWTGIPVTDLTEGELDKLMRLEGVLQERVIGQDQAIHEIVSAIQMHRMGFADQRKPIGSFLLLGPTGVGKTEIAKSIARVLFGSEKDLIRIDMSEYMEKHSVSRLIGSPPGYVGYEEGGQLTEQLRHRPYAVVLFDEFEKAHPDVWNILLQMLDDGCVTDNQGRTISTKETIILLTSNIGSDIILQEGKVDGIIKNEIIQMVKKMIRPELINRLDSIVVFNALSPEVIRKIARKKLDELRILMQEKDILIRYEEDVVSWVAENGFDKEFGVRPLERLIKKEIVHEITLFVMKYKNQHREDKKRIDIKIFVADNKIVVSE
jgi:ATP-dependent Clp protease ATP-binding subunit ClpB